MRIAGERRVPILIRASGLNKKNLENRLCCVLLFLLIALAVFFLNHEAPPRARSRPPTTGSGGSSSRSRMAARWAHMDNGSLGGRPKAYADEQGDEVEESIKPGAEERGPEDANDFGVLPSVPRRGSESLNGSLVGTGPNGTRTFLKGWFGLDEPNFSGFNTTPDEREKDPDAFPMRKPEVVPHHRVPTNDDQDWETHSNASDVA